jgi:valyl-tRNA synthetase
MAKKLTEIPKKSLHLAVSGKTTGLARAYLPIEGILDIVEEKKRLERELGALTARRERLAQKLADEQFVKRAPTSVVAEERRKLAEIELTITQYDEQRKVLASLVNGTNSNR